MNLSVISQSDPVLPRHDGILLTSYHRGLLFHSVDMHRGKAPLIGTSVAMESRKGLTMDPAALTTQARVGEHLLSGWKGNPWQHPDGVCTSTFIGLLFISPNHG